MAMETLVGGLEVELGEVERQLATIWKQDDGISTRASLINFVVYSEDPEAARRNSDWLGDITRDHSCRAILVAAEPLAEQADTKAWISAHCHVSKAGAKQVCCEQISFRLRGQACKNLTPVVLSHLDSDLPLFLWWQASVPEDSQLFRWVDRLFFDSQTWSRPAHEFQRLRHLTQRGRTTLRDLNWTRLGQMRWVLAHMFDHQEVLGAANQIRQIRVTHSPEARSTAALLVGWLSSRLGWQSDGTVPRNAQGAVEIQLRPEGGLDLSGVEIDWGGGHLKIATDSSAEHMHSLLDLGDRCLLKQTLPAGKLDTLNLLKGELSRGGNHNLYLDAWRMALPWLGRQA